MTSVRRVDATTSHTAKIVDGVLQAPARLTRVGVFVYQLSDGSISKEWRPPEEVFSASSIATLNNSNYLTLGHPANGWVDSKNYRLENRGTVSNAHQDGDFLAANVKVVDQDAIDSIQDGVIELSCGYTATRTPTPGLVVVDPVTKETITVDATMSDIKYNHVAIVQAGRAGNECRVLLDSAPNIGIQMNPEIKLDVVEQVKDETPKVEVPVEVAPVVQEVPVAVVDLKPLLDNANQSIESLTAQLELATKAAAELQAKVDELNAKLTAVVLPANLDSLAQARLSVTGLAAEYHLKTDGVDTNILRQQILLKINPALKLDTLTDSLETIYAAVVSQRTDLAPKLETTAVVSLQPDVLTAAYAARKAAFGY